MDLLITNKVFNIEEVMDEFYTRTRNLIKPWKSKNFLEFAKGKYPTKVLHHAIGSMGSLKLTDLLLIPLDRLEHGKADRERAKYFKEYLPFMLNLVQEYITKLEKENEEIKRRFQET